MARRVMSKYRVTVRMVGDNVEWHCTGDRKDIAACEDFMHSTEVVTNGTVWTLPEALGAFADCIAHGLIGMKEETTDD